MAWAGGSGVVGAAETPEAVAQAQTERFHATLLQTAALTQQTQREAQLVPLIEDVFDVARIAAISLGRTWRELDTAQQAAFIDLLGTLIVATYADRFDSFSGQRFTTDRIEAVRSGYVVYTRLLRDDAEDVSLDYFFRNGRIFNVVADGVSDLSLRRADYNAILKQEGYEALLKHMRSKLDLARGGS